MCFLFSDAFCGVKRHRLSGLGSSWLQTHEDAAAPLLLLLEIVRSRRSWRSSPNKLRQWQSGSPYLVSFGFSNLVMERKDQVQWQEVPAVVLAIFRPPEVWLGARFFSVAIGYPKSHLHVCHSRLPAALYTIIKLLITAYHQNASCSINKWQGAQDSKHDCGTSWKATESIKT